MTQPAPAMDPRRERLAVRLRRLKTAILAAVGAGTLGLWLAISGAAAGVDASSGTPADASQLEAGSDATDSTRSGAFFSNQQPSLQLNGTSAGGQTPMLRSGGS